jgi:hypothetical protein
MNSKWAHAFVQSGVGKNVNRWASKIITHPSDQNAYNRFLLQERTSSHLALLTGADSSTVDRIALSALNKFTSLRKGHPFAPDNPQMLRDIQVPKTSVDKSHQTLFLNCVGDNMKMSRAYIKDGMTGTGVNIGKFWPDPITRAICHVTSALVPNIVCVIDNQPDYANVHEAIRKQLNILNLGDTVEDANNKGILVCVYMCA